MGDDDTFAQTQDTAEKTYPIRAGEVKKGMIVMLKGKQFNHVQFGRD